MKRAIYSKLLAWKHSKTRKPLLLQGARQVGKTFILKEFGREYSQVVYLNFEKEPKFSQIFEESLDPKNILKNLSLLLSQKISPDQTLLILDEIQECPAAIKSLKYFHEEANEYAIAAAGSLLGVKLNKLKGFPVGQVDLLTLYPCTFFEFLSAVGKHAIKEVLESQNTIAPFSQSLHEELLKLLKIYFVVGGMPEAVAHYAKTEDLNSVRMLHHTLIKTYEFDFAKHADPHDTLKINLIWESLGRQLAKENKKFIFSAIEKSARAREYENAIEWLKNAGLVLKVHLVETPKIPLEGYKDLNAFKLYAHDVGLLATKTQIPLGALLEGDHLYTEYKGALTENFVAQELTACGHNPLYYWTSHGSAEVDFLVQSEGKIIPLEVKAGGTLHKKSLQVYAQKYTPHTLNRTNTLNFVRDGNFINFPLYLISRFPWV